MTVRYQVALCLLIASLTAQCIQGIPPECDPATNEGHITKQQRYECLVKEYLDPDRYSPLVRPVANINDTVTVKFSVQLSQIINIDEKNQVMKTNVWLQMYWFDYQLQWDNNVNYNDIKVFRIDPNLMWRPDVVLFNNADGNYEVSYLSNVVVYSDGQISWIPPAIYKSSCSIDVQFFPFDEQVCFMKFGSWTFLEDQLNFTFYYGVPHLDVSDYLVNGAWDIKNGDAEITRSPVGNNKDFKSMITFRFVIRRKTLFYTVNLIIPCVLISFVTLSVFLLPAEAGEKITLAISILLALVVFLLLISKILPPALTVPLISQYLMFTFIMNIIAIVCTVVVINRNYRTARTHQMPYWVRLIFLNYLPRILFIARPDHDTRWLENPDEKKDKQTSRTRGLKLFRKRNRDPDLTHTVNYTLAVKKRNARNTPNVVDEGEEPYVETHHPNCRLNPPAETDETTVETSFIDQGQMSISPEILKAAESLKFIHNHLKKDDDYHTVIDDWRYVARVIDRLLLIIFLIVTISGTIGVFFKAPHILENVDQEGILDAYNKNWLAAMAK